MTKNPFYFKALSKNKSIYKMIDSHCHLWDLSLGYQPWLINNKESSLLGSLQSLKKDYFIKNYIEDSYDFYVEKIVHIESASSQYGKQEVDWVLNHSYDSLLVGAVIGSIDFFDDNCHEILEYYSQTSLVKGVRQILNWHNNSKYTAANRHDDLINPIWHKHYQSLKNYDLMFEMQICPSQMKQVSWLVRQFPDIKVIVNHSGMPIDKEF
jgi:predicted TIM-barrel fold metal-dependent hydrolase